MKMKIITATVAFAVGVTLAGIALAQGTTPRVVPPFDPKTVETFSGVVVTEAQSPNLINVHVIMVKAGGDLRPVVLGPRRAIDPALTKLGQKTEVEITASKVLSNGTPIYLASAVKVGGKSYTLRDEHGKFTKVK